MRRAAVLAAEMAAAEAAFPFEWEVERRKEVPPPPPRVPFDPQARIEGWEGTLLTRLLASAVPARWAAQAEMAAVLVEELGCDASAPIAAHTACHAVPGAATVMVDTTGDYTLMHAVSALWLARLGSRPWPHGRDVRPHQPPPPPPRVAAAALRHILNRVPALGAALRERRRGLLAGCDVDSQSQEQQVAQPAPADVEADAAAPAESAGLVGARSTFCASPASTEFLPQRTVPLRPLQGTPAPAALGWSPVEAALLSAPYLWPTGVCHLPVVHEILASGDRNAVEHYLGVDLPRLSAALLPAWAAEGPMPALPSPWLDGDGTEPALARAETVYRQLQDVLFCGEWHLPQPDLLLQQEAVTQLPRPPVSSVEAWLRLKTHQRFALWAGGNWKIDSACYDLSGATQAELRSGLRKSVRGLQAARAAAGEVYVSMHPRSLSDRWVFARWELPQHMANALALLAEWARRKPGGAAVVACARAAARGGPPPTAWWPTPPQLVEEGDAEVAAAAAEVAVAGVLHGWPTGDVWLALGLVGAAGQASWLRRLLAELSGLHAPADGHPPPLMASVPLTTESPLLALRHPARLEALSMVLQHPDAASVLGSDTMSSLFRLAYTFGPGYARLLLQASAAATTLPSRNTPAAAPMLSDAWFQLLVECCALGRIDARGAQPEAEAVEQHRRRVLATAVVILDQARQSAAGECVMHSLPALRHTASGRTLLHLAALADGRLPRLLTAAVPGLAAQMSVADGSGGTPLEAATSGYRRAEGLLHLVRCGAQVYDDSGALRAAVLLPMEPAHDRCVLLDAIAASGARLMSALLAGWPAAHAPLSLEAALAPLLAQCTHPMLLRRLMSWAPGCLDAYTRTLDGVKTCTATDRHIAPGYFAAERLSRHGGPSPGPTRALVEVVRLGVAPIYLRRLEPSATSPVAVTWAGNVPPCAHPMLLREVAWARRGPILALRHRLRKWQRETGTATTYKGAVDMAGVANH
jgi:hypothetical protein